MDTYYSDDTSSRIDELYNNDFEIETSKDALNELFRYPFRGETELGKSISKYKGATRVDITKEHECHIVRSPDKFLNVLKLMAKEANVTPSYGLKVENGSNRGYIHFLLELNENSSVGVFFYDSKRMLSVPQIHNVERMIRKAGLRGGIIVANNIGMPSKQEAKRINDEVDGPGLITIEHYDSLEKRLKMS